MIHAKKKQSITQKGTERDTKVKNWNTTLERNTADITERDKKEKNVAKNSTVRDTIAKGTNDVTKF